MKYQFFGGPYDGDFISLTEPMDVVYVPDYQPPEIKLHIEDTLIDPSIKTSLYLRETICYKEFDFLPPNYIYIYVFEGMKIGFG